MMIRKNYWEIESLSEVFLEDSYVLEISINFEEIRIKLDLVLRSDHPRHSIPPEHEKYCYKEATFLFTGVSSVSYEKFKVIRNMGSDGTIDYGNIDFFSSDTDEKHFTVSGEWGSISILAENFKVLYEDNSESQK